jgi:hypothetical protein
MRRFSFMTLVFGIMLATLAVAQSVPSQPTPSRSQIARNYQALPLSFESNQGQAGPRIKFLSRGAGYAIFFSKQGAVLALSKKTPQYMPPRKLSALHSEHPEHKGFKTDFIRMQLVDVSKNLTPSGERHLPGTVNYFTGNDSTKWHSKVDTFQRVKYTGAYPGVDLVYYGNQQHLEFDFEVAPGADPGLIRLHFAGARKLKLDHEGNLTIVATNGEIMFHAPAIYQIVDGNTKQQIRGTFQLASADTVGFQLGTYNHQKPLVIDPILAYSTYMGQADVAAAIAVDSAGYAYITGYVDALGLPTTSGTFQQAPVSKPSDMYSAFITKFNSTGTELVYSTYVSGSNSDEANSIAIDSQGNAYIAGQTNSLDFPTTTGAFQSTNITGSQTTGFITKLNNTGTAIMYSTYLGGNVSNNSTSNTIQGSPIAIAVDTLGNAYVTGTTSASNFPTTPGAFQTISKATNATYLAGFLTKINPAGTALVYSTYLSGSKDVYPTGIAIDAQGSAYVAGATYSVDFPTTSGAFQLSNKSIAETGFLTKMSTNGTNLVYSTYLGGTNQDYASAISVDSFGNAYLTGSASSFDFPTTPGAFQSVLAADSGNAFVTKVNATGTALIYSTFLGGTTQGTVDRIDYGAEDSGVGIAVDSIGNAVVVGTSESIDFPTTPGAFQTQNLSWLNSGNDGSFLTKLNSTGTQLLYSTYFGGSGDLSGQECDCINGIALDSSDNAYVAGRTVSTDFPITPGAYQSTPPTFSGAFVTKFNASEMTLLPITTTTVTANVNPQANGSPVAFTIHVKPSPGISTPTGTVGISTNANPWVSLPLDSTGSAVYTTSSLPSFANVVVAYYLGDANSAPSTGSATETITQLASVVTLISNANPAAYGAPVTFTATAQDSSGNAIPGFISFIIGNTEYALVSLDSTGHATWTTTSLAAGIDTVIARYTGTNATYAPQNVSITESVIPIGIAATPIFTPSGGNYTSSQQVTLSDTTPGAAIYYTTDGSVPAINSGTRSEYFQPISVSTNQTLNAIAIANGYSQSTVSSAAYNINLPTPDFTLSLAPASLSVASNQAASTMVSIASLSGFSQTISFSCSGLPPGISCNFSPSSVTPIFGSGATTLTVSANSIASQASPISIPFLPVTALAFVLFWFGPRRRRQNSLLQLVALSTISLFLLSGCGNSKTLISSPPPVTSAISLTATAGSLAHSTTLTVTVNQ